MEHASSQLVIPSATGHRLNSITAEEINGLNCHEALHRLFRNCALAALNAGTKDGITTVEQHHQNFDIILTRDNAGVELLLMNPPASAIKTLRGVPRIIEVLAEHVRSIACDLLAQPHLFPPDGPHKITDGIRNQLERNNLLEGTKMNGHVLTRLTFQGGQLITNPEYYFKKEEGRQAGYTGYGIITGGGNGTMRAPFSGATAGYRAQCISNPKMIGLTCPSIIANEPPNTFVNPLVTFPDMEKRLEAFVRMAMGTVIGPGGVGTIEEALYLMAIICDPRNQEHVFAIVLSGPERQFFEMLEHFIQQTLGDEVWAYFRSRCSIEVGDPEKSMRKLTQAIDGPGGVREFRRAMNMSEFWDELVTIDEELQRPFLPSHEAVSTLQLNRHQSPMQLIIELRKAISAIIWALVTAEGNHAIQEQPLRISGEQRIKQALEMLLEALRQQGRMNLRDPNQDHLAYRFV